MTTHSPRVVDQIPSGVREAINWLFTTRTWPASKSDRMLEHLLRYAHVEYRIIEQHNWHAKIAIHNLLKTYDADREMQETCCYQTLHIFVRLLCTLGILKKQECPGQTTTYLLSLDLDYRFQVSIAILAGIDRLCDPEQTKNLKMRKKALDVKRRLLLMKPVPQPIQSLGDLVEGESPIEGVLGDSFSNTLANESTVGPSLGDSVGGESSNDGILGDSIVVLPGQRKPSFEHERRLESPNNGKNLPDAAPSSLEFLSLDRDSLGKELELEIPMGERWTGSEEELSQEAVRYLKLLDGPEYGTSDYLNTHAGKKAVGGYKNKIRRNPSLARIAAINTLLQRTFYDLTRQKKPLENAGKWFHGSFDRYADPLRPMEITGEILDWAKSPYTLQEIALVLPRERKRQETQWWSPEAAHLPFSSCVRIHQHLQDEAPALPMSPSEKQREIFRFETTRQSVEGSLESPTTQWMSCAEAEQLAEEIRSEASWYLDEIHVSPEPRLDENASVVEAFIADTTFPVAYASRQDWWLHHQEQVGHQIREEQRKEKKRKKEMR